MISCDKMMSKGQEGVVKCPIGKAAASYHYQFIISCNRYAIESIEEN